MFDSPVCDMLAGVILIDTAGAAVGKCNGLTVLEVGDSAVA